MGNYKIFDYESGEYNEVSKEQFEAHKKWLEKVKSIIRPSVDGVKGSVQITSTQSDEGSSEFYKQLWQTTTLK